MSQFRFEKQRVPATLTLGSGSAVAGFVFVAAHTAHRGGGERVGDLLNGETGFFPFQLPDGTTVL